MELVSDAGGIDRVGDARTLEWTRWQVVVLGRVVNLNITQTFRYDSEPLPSYLFREELCPILRNEAKVRREGFDLLGD